jgi:hypothetical protein
MAGSDVALLMLEGSAIRPGRSWARAGKGGPPPAPPVAHWAKMKSPLVRLTWWSSWICISAPEWPAVLTSTTV